MNAVAWLTALSTVAGLATGCYRHSMNDLDTISAFSVTEVEAAIAIMAPADDAKRIAAEIFAIPKAERHKYGWTEYAIPLLAMVSPETQTKVERIFGGTADEWERRGRSFVDFRRAGNISEGMGIEDFVVQ